jgi:hypothetical protein
VNQRAVGREVEKLIEEVGFEKVRVMFGISGSGLRSLRNGTRGWGWKHVEKLANKLGGGEYDS